ncbi:MAG: efflux RND transporter periplasmic adaptor subunit [Acidobacteria bacterium]|nr:efflux RND transporter periplasmic adaptor subunit [Acidobacteriota bacterium]
MADTVTTHVQEPSGVEPPPNAYGKAPWWVLAIAGGAVLVGLALYVKPASPPADSKSPDMTPAKESIAVKEGAPQWKFLKLGTVGQVGSHWTDSVPGRISIDESRSSRVGVPVEGRVTRVMAELGDSVREGQPLFAIVSPAIDELRAARQQAQVELEAARTALTRVEATVASRALPAKELEAARQRVRTAEVAVQVAEAKLTSVRAGTSGTDLVIPAPRGGVVVDKTVVVNQQVGPDSPSMMTVADLSSVWVVADVFESQTLDIRPGGTAEVTSPSLPGMTLNGKVLMVSSVGDPERHTLPVRVGLANADHRLRPNVYARVRFNVQHADASIEIPATAIVSDGERQFVYVQDTPGHFVKREVVAGSAHEGRMPVFKGLTPGETIVEEGAILLDNQIVISQ